MTPPPITQPNTRAVIGPKPVFPASSRSIAVCFYGIPRSLEITIETIRKNVIAPSRARADVHVLAHFYTQRTIDNPRTGERTELDPEVWKLLEPDGICLDEPGHCLGPLKYDEYISKWPRWSRDPKSLSNLLHQLNSIDAVTRMAIETEADICIFARPDLLYHDSLAKVIDSALAATAPVAFIPRWQPWSGLNDRFAICTGRAAIEALGHRVTRIDACAGQSPRGHVVAEELVLYSLLSDDIRIEKIRARASRVRSNGVVVREDFSAPPVFQIRRKFKTLRNAGVEGMRRFIGRAPRN